MSENKYPPILVLKNRFLHAWKGDMGPDIGPRVKPSSPERYKGLLDDDGYLECVFGDYYPDPIKALTRDYFDDDAHAVMYLLEGQEDFPRLSKEILQRNKEIKPYYAWLIVDVDSPGHVPLEDHPPELLSDLDALEKRLDLIDGFLAEIKQAEKDIPELSHALKWQSKHGFKYAWPLAENRRYPVEIGEDYHHMFLEYLEANGLDVDMNAKDWTRLMRMPRTLRDGVPQDYAVDGIDTLKMLDWEPPRAPRVSGGRSRRTPPTGSTSVIPSGNALKALIKRAKEALAHVDPDCDYATWLKIGMGLKDAFQSAGFAVWDGWSKGASGYPGVAELQDKWASFGREHGERVTIRSIFHICRDHGWEERAFDVKKAEAILNNAFTPEDYFSDEVLDAAARLRALNGAEWAAVLERTKGAGGPPRFSDWERRVRDRLKEIETERRIADAAERQLSEEKSKEDAPGAITNFLVGTDSEGESVRFRKSVREIIKDLRASTGGWPRLVDDVPFAPNPYIDHTAAYFTTSAMFKAWIEMSGLDYKWSDRDLLDPSDGEMIRPVGESHMFAAAKLSTPEAYRYKSVEHIPHIPDVPGVFYFDRDLPESTGEALEAFLDVFNADSPADRDLIEALILTGMWGGDPGKRPAFVITSDHGRAAGKSSTAQAIARIYGGLIDVKAEERPEDLQARLLDPSTISTRFCLIDNLKNPLSSGPFESMITAPAINGKRMYVGDGKRTNLLTWVFTANTPSLSNDLSTRSVVIKIGPPDKTGFDFDSWINDFLKERGDDLLSDIKARLEGPDLCEIQTFDRWQAWQKGVLAKFERGEDMARIIIDRRATVDDTTGMAMEWAEKIRAVLVERGHDPDTVKTVIPSAVLVEIAREVEQDRMIGYRKMWTILRDLIGVGPMARTNKRNGSPRGLAWVGIDSKKQDVYEDFSKR